MRRESEKLAKKLAAEGRDLATPPTVHLFKSCFHEVDGNASYDTDCSNKVIAEEEARVATADAAADAVNTEAPVASETDSESEVVSESGEVVEEAATKEEL